MLRHQLSEFFSAVTFADNKIFRSLKLILFSPGGFSKNYAEGIRVKYMKPISVFFLANLIYFLFPFINTFTTSLELQISAFPYSDWAEKKVELYLLEADVSMKEFATMYNIKTTELSKVALILFALTFTVFSKCIHIGSKRNLWVDNFTVSLEFLTFFLIFGLEVLILLMYPFVKFFDFGFLYTDSGLIPLGFVVTAFFFIKAERKFFEFGKARTGINVVLNIASLVFTLSIYRGLLFLITFYSIIL
ncbi:MAG: DUF3667 domain-containing protein [Bacteroidota bacterium]